MPFTFQDPINPQVYLVCGSKESEEMYRKQRREATSDSSYPYTGLINIQSNSIAINLMCNAHELIWLRKFLEWLIPQYDFRITDDYGNDWTQKCKEQGVSILFE